MTLAEWSEARKGENSGSTEAFVRFLGFLKAFEHDETDAPPEYWDNRFANWEPPA